MKKKVLFFAAMAMYVWFGHAQISSFPWIENFENGNASVNGFTMNDDDGDSYCWYLNGHENCGTGRSHSGIGSLYSYAPNHDCINWLILPSFSLPADASSFELTWFENGYHDENIMVYISTSGNTISDFQATSPVFSSAVSATNIYWTKRTVDLSQYSGQTIHIAFLHFTYNSGQHILNIDDIAIGNPEDIVFIDGIGIDSLSYNVYGTFAAVNRYYYSRPSYVIPDQITVNGHVYPVKGIARRAFNENSTVTSVTIPNSVTYIGSLAFGSCIGLTSVTIPEAVTYIANGGFNYCINMTSVVFNARNCSSDGDGPFSSCSNLASITFGDNVRRIPKSLCRNRTGLTTITIPNSVTKIADHAFEGCTGLTSLTLGSSVDTISIYAFYGCSNLTSLTLPASLHRIAYGVFQNCSRLTSVTIPNSVDCLAQEVFAGCTALASVVIGNGVTDIYANAFGDCNHLTNIALGSGVQTIASTAFSGCTAVLRMSIRATTPPTSTSNPFSGFNTSIPVSVPCNSVSAYQNAPYWGFFSNLSGEASSFSATAADPTQGTVQIIHAPDCDNLQAEVQAIPYNGFHFVRWSDGNTEAHRYIVVTSDVAIQAIFAVDGSEGVDDIVNTEMSISVSNGRITAIGPENKKMFVFDISGRLVGYSETGEVVVPTSGVYLVRVGNRPAHKVVVVR